MSFAEGAAMGLVYLTAHFALVERGGLEPGETVLVTGAAGGVGLATVQVAKALGAIVVAAVGSEDKAALARRERRATTSCAPTFPTCARASAGRCSPRWASHGVDLIVDTVGGDVFDASLRAIAWCGRLVTVGYASGRVPEVKAGLLLVKNISLIGLQVSDYRDRTPDKMRQVQAELLALYEAGKLKPHVMKIVSAGIVSRGARAVADRRRVLARSCSP